MKKLRSLAVILMVITFMFSAVGCSGTSDRSSSTDADSTSASTDSEAIVSTRRCSKDCIGLRARQF